MDIKATIIEEKSIICRLCLKKLLETDGEEFNYLKIEMLKLMSVDLVSNN